MNLQELVDTLHDEEKVYIKMDGDFYYSEEGILNNLVHEIVEILDGNLSDFIVLYMFIDVDTLVIECRSDLI